MNSSAQNTTEDDFASRLPRWQVVLLLVGFPLVYLANSFTPWSYRLFVEHDHQYFVPFAMSVCVLHWSSVLLALVFVKRAGGESRDIGLRLRLRGVVTYAAVVIAVGGAFIALRQTWPMLAEPPEGWQVMYPFTMAERCFWVFISFTAGFCEEFVYRGFVIRGRHRRGWPTWQAVLLATLSFVFIHGAAAFFAFPFFVVCGLIFAGLFLWRKSLTPGMYAHALFDVMAVMAI